MQVKIAHDDHGLTDEHVDFVTEIVTSQDEGFFIDIRELPEQLPDLLSALYGPSCGDAPVVESEVIYEKRNGRAGFSRLVLAPHRACRKVVVIGIKGKSLEDSIVFTAYGTQAEAPSPKEWWDPSMQPAECIVSATFWSIHALAKEPSHGES
ncbi:MAG: hypothetical protein Unbinned4336contig1001_26 [Prokaryotic dsDNA virus sp.]|nr:MAG: hypothetical protein Unbinned4336contig1001_26 [Prokaryotic dsDNA virus sp.]|tara:strand:+ start:273 stop:728 length:456 start_codon:yes stop_codon:yes gene_type:complete